jgi:hypothetical protein
MGLNEVDLEYTFPEEYESYATGLAGLKVCPTPSGSFTTTAKPGTVAGGAVETPATATFTSKLVVPPITSAPARLLGLALQLSTAQGPALSVSVPEIRAP